MPRGKREREAVPPPPVIDIQSAKSAEKRGPASIRMAMNAGKKIKGKKRHILVDTAGLLLHAIVSGRYPRPQRRLSPSGDTVRDVSVLEKAATRVSFRALACLLSYGRVAGFGWPGMNPPIRSNTVKLKKSKRAGPECSTGNNLAAWELVAFGGRPFPPTLSGLGR